MDRKNKLRRESNAARGKTPIAEESCKNNSQSSLFDIHREMRDRGSSIVCLADTPSALLARKGPQIEYENTFKLEPDRKLDLNRIKEVCEEVLEYELGSKQYNPIEAPVIIKRVTKSVLSKLKTFVYERYKLVVLVNLTQKPNPGIKIASRFLWSEKHDNWVDAYYANSSLSAQATVYGLYYE